MNFCKYALIKPRFWLRDKWQLSIPESIRDRLMNYQGSPPDWFIFQCQQWVLIDGSREPAPLWRELPKVKKKLTLDRFTEVPREVRARESERRLTGCSNNPIIPSIRYRIHIEPPILSKENIYETLRESSLSLSMIYRWYIYSTFWTSPFEPSAN